MYKRIMPGLKDKQIGQEYNYLISTNISRSNNPKKAVKHVEQNGIFSLDAQKDAHNHICIRATAGLE